MARGWLYISISLTALLGLGGLSLTAARQQGERPTESPNADWRRVTPLIWSGPTPDESSFERLFAQSVRTIVSVDGARPNIEAASAAGLEYVHIPIGYDEVPESAVDMLTRVMREKPAPIYVHCHHGKHRGPTAAAICAMIAGELDHDRALAFLEAAGTSHDYTGLWKSVASFQPIPDRATLPELVSVADVDPLVDIMVRIDDRFESLQQAISSEQSGDEARRIALLLHEDFRETSRLSQIEENRDFATRLAASVSLSRVLVDALDHRSQEDVSLAVTRLHESCSACHRRHRN